MTALANSADRADLLGRDQRFFDALVAGDPAALGDLLTDDFILVSISDGAAVPGAVLLDAVSSGAVTFPAIQSFPDEAVVRRIGNVGIIVGRTGMNFDNADGSTFTAASRYTHVYVHSSDLGWRLASAQGTEIKATA